MMNQNNSASDGNLSVPESPSSGSSSSTPALQISPTSDQAHPSALASLIELYKSDPALLCSLFSGNPSGFGVQPLMNNASIVNPATPIIPDQTIYGYPLLHHTAFPNTTNVLLRPHSSTPSSVPSYVNSNPPYNRSAFTELYKTLSGAFDPPVAKTLTTVVSSEIVPEFPPNSNLFNHFNNHSPSKGNGWKQEWNQMLSPKRSPPKHSKEEQRFKINFQPFQIEALKEKLKATKYLTTEEREKLELETGLNKNQIMDWFSYRRNKQDMTVEKKKIIRFTEEQKSILRPHFVPGQNVPMSTCRLLGAQAGMTSEQVRGWFSKQNRRLRLAEEKKKNGEEQEANSTRNS